MAESKDHGVVVRLDDYRRPAKVPTAQIARLREMLRHLPPEDFREVEAEITVRYARLGLAFP